MPPLEYTHQLNENSRSTQGGEELKPLKSIAKELFSCSVSLFKSELALAKTEFRETTSKTSKYFALLTGCAFLAVLGTFPILAFLVIGLGELLNGNYWLSSLLVGLFLVITGSLLGFMAYKKIKSANFLLPRTRESLSDEVQMINRKIQEISEFRKDFRKPGRNS